MKQLSLIALILAASLHAQAPGAQVPSFDVASIKPAAEPSGGRGGMICLIPCSPGESLTVEGARVDIRYMSLYKLILTAYRLKPYQLTGPDWIRTQRFDIAAKLPDAASKSKLPEMLQSLLAERFKLTFHLENKEQPVYELVVAKSGLKLPAPSADADAPLPATPGGRGLYSPDGAAYMEANGNVSVVGGPVGPVRFGRGGDGTMKTDMLSITMPQLADMLTPHQDHPVIDKTNLTGAYRFTCEIAPPAGGGEGGRKGGEPTPTAGGPPAEPPRDLFGDALAVALTKAGLKLEKSKAPVETLVIDHLEKNPTGN